MDKRLAAVAVFLGALVLAALIVIGFGSPEFIATTAGDTATSDNFSFLFMLLFMFLPAVFLYFATKDGDESEKEKHKRYDPSFEKPKNDDMQFTIGADGELIPMVDEPDHTQQLRR